MVCRSVHLKAACVFLTYVSDFTQFKIDGSGDGRVWRPSVLKGKEGCVFYLNLSM